MKTMRMGFKLALISVFLFLSIPGFVAAQDDNVWHEGWESSTLGTQGTGYFQADMGLWTSDPMYPCEIVTGLDGKAVKTYHQYPVPTPSGKMNPTGAWYRFSPGFPLVEDTMFSGQCQSAFDGYMYNRAGYIVGRVVIEINGWTMRYMTPHYINYDTESFEEWEAKEYLSPSLWDHQIGTSWERNLYDDFAAKYGDAFRQYESCYIDMIYVEIRPNIWRIDPSLPKHSDPTYFLATTLWDNLRLYSSNALVIQNPRTDDETYSLEDRVLIGCLIVDSFGNEVFDAEVFAEITKPDGITKDIVPLHCTDMQGYYNPAVTSNYLGIYEPAKILEMDDSIPEEELRGTYTVTLSAERDGYGSVESDAFSFEVAQTRLKVRVFYMKHIWDVDGNKKWIDKVLPAPDVTVFVSREGDDTYERQTLITDSHGSVSMDIEEPGAYHVELDPTVIDNVAIGYDPEYNPQVVNISSGKTVRVFFPSDFFEQAIQWIKDQADRGYVLHARRMEDMLETLELAQIEVSLLIATITGGTTIPTASEFAVGVINNVLTKVDFAYGENMIRESYEEQLNVFLNIMKDPPDPNYQDVFNAVFPDPISLPPDPDSLVTQAMVDLVNAFRNINVLDKALLISIERYQGAMESGGAEFMILQLGAIADYLDAMSVAGVDLADALMAVQSEIQAIWDARGTDIIALQARLSSEGFTFEEEEGLRELGLTDADLAAYRSFLIELDIEKVILALGELAMFYQERSESALDIKGEAAGLGEFLQIPIEPEVVSVDVKIKPKTINLASKGKFTVFITLPDTIDPADVTVNSIFCEGAPAVSWKAPHKKSKKKSKKKHNRYIVKFNKKDLKDVSTGHIGLTVYGNVDYQGASINFEGSDIVRIIDNRGRSTKRLLKNPS